MCVSVPLRPLPGGVQRNQITVNLFAAAECNRRPRWKLSHHWRLYVQIQALRAPAPHRRVYAHDAHAGPFSGASVVWTWAFLAEQTADTS